MSAENVEIVRRVYEAVARGDSEAVLAAYDPAIQMEFSQSPLRSLFKREVYRGHEGLRDFFHERQEEAWRSIVDRCDELVDVGPGQVVTVVTTHGRGRASGAEVELVHAGLWTVRDGRIVRSEWFGSREQALEAAAAAG